MASSIRRSRKISDPAFHLLVVSLLATVWSLIHPVDYATWFFEIFLGAIGVSVLVVTAGRFRFSRVIYLVVAVHFIILAAGAKYSYATMPLFDWLKESLDLSRNHFDRVGHFFQGLTPTLIMRELLVRKLHLPANWKVAGLSICVALAFSASYEILEWLWVLVFYPDCGPEWLGMQGDPWDAQADMLMALCGAIIALLFFGPLQSRQIQSIEASKDFEQPSSG